MPEQPDYGAERITLFPPKRKGGKHTLMRQVFTEEGHTTFYDEDAKDWTTWPGSWHPVETLGKFDGKDDARDFMLARAPASTRNEARG